MGCRRDNVNHVIDIPVAISGQGEATRLFSIPPNVQEGQMTFYNTGATNLYIGVKSERPTTKDAYMKIPAGKAYTEEGIIAGDVTVVSDVAGGIITACTSFT